MGDRKERMTGLGRGGGIDRWAERGRGEQRGGWGEGENEREGESEREKMRDRRRGIEWERER